MIGDISNVSDVGDISDVILVESPLMKEGNHVYTSLAANSGSIEAAVR